MTGHWSEYWKQGHITSFGSDYEKNYTGQLKDIWSNIFSQFPMGFKVLDVATGNGALPLLIQDYFSKLSVEGNVKGVDYADINLVPLVNSHINKNVVIELLGNTSAESLPFSDFEFDTVISQFGIEYSDLVISVPEVLRVLRDQGTFHAVIHHQKSVVIRYNSKLLSFLQYPEIERLVFLLKVMAHDMGEMINRQDLIRIRSCAICEKSRIEINALLSKLAAYDEISLSETGILSYVNVFFRNGLFWSIEKKLEYLAFVSKQITVYRQRLTELVEASMSFECIDTFREILNQSAVTTFSVEEVVNNTGDILAWYVFFSKDSH
ncbi:class I SAM-dependent methyltransferase [Shewanella sp. SP1S1-7]|uniref:class I SAM-dependent methyltransferase n=1 Tax=unclassified Shewanella TaxID=196818 RepID=UPI002892187D|nr:MULTISPECIES: class I SAM-dependent methyltransferase [unclassified Shewanella]MDT3321518.1 class I SAM-dependent methyltransferase [Shewanella sp. SP1S2-4]MDT3335550.1 class I SAM-dependent methyltransferase [Shewanella sp. SP1S1-7]